MPRPNLNYYTTTTTTTHPPSFLHDLYPRGPQNTFPHPPHSPTPTPTPTSTTVPKPSSSSSSSMPFSLTILVPLLIFSLLLNIAIAYLWWTAHRNHGRRRLTPDEADMHSCECCGRGPSPEGRMRKARLERELRFVGVRPGRRSWFGMLRDRDEELGVDDGAAAAAADGAGARVDVQLPTVATTTTSMTKATTDSKKEENNGLFGLRLIAQARANANANPNADPRASTNPNPNPFADPLRQHPSFCGLEQQHPPNTYAQTQAPAPTRNHNRKRNRNSLSMFAAQLVPHPPARDLWPPRLDSLAVKAAHQKPRSFYIERGLDTQDRGREDHDVELQALAGNAAPMGMEQGRNAGQERALAMLEGRSVIGDDDDDNSSDDADKEYEIVAGPAPQEQQYAHGRTLGTRENGMSPGCGHQ